MNKVELYGRADRITRSDVNGKVKTSFTVIITSKMNNREFTDYVPVEIWRELNNLQSGDDVRVEGKFATTSWDNQSGGKSYKSFVVAYKVFKMIRLDGDSYDTGGYEQNFPSNSKGRTAEFYSSLSGSPEEIF